MFENEQEELLITFVPKEGGHLTIHHRKPTVIGGRKTKRNESKVLRSRHTAWHMLYDILPATDISLKFQEDCEIYGNWNPKSPLLTRIVEGYANSSKAKIKRRQSWFLLFKGMSLEDIVLEVNAIWIDPDYEIKIGLERIKKVWVTQTK